MITGGLTTELSADGFKTAIDGFVQEAYEREQIPGYLGASDSLFFKQGNINTRAFIWDEYTNVGIFDEKGEQEEITTTNAFLGNQKTVNVLKWMKSIPISYEAFKTDQHGLREQIGRDIGDRGRLTQDMKEVLNTYGDAFAGSVNTTPDGDALASNSHTTLGGGGQTVDNLETGALAPDALWTAVTSLAGQKAQDGDPGSYMFEGLGVPFNLYKTAKEVLNSTLVANSGENNVNVFDTDYGQVAIRASVYLTTTYNSATNAATSYHLISRSHQIMRKVLADLNTSLIPPENSRTDSYELRARFMEVAFPGSWCGYVGSNGSA